MSEADSDTIHELRNVTGGRNRRCGAGCCGKHPVACGVTLLVVGLVSLGVVGTAIGIRPYLHKTFRDTVNKQVQLVPGSEGTSEFKKSSAPLYTKFYFFNVTNHDDVTSKGADPHVVQCGPYTYREWRTKTNLKWNDNETIVHYDLNVTYTFERSMSSGDPKVDVIRALNIPLYVLLLKIKALEEKNKLNDFLEKVLKIIVEIVRKAAGEQGLFMTITVDKLLFGYNDTLLSDLEKAVEKFDELFHKHFAINPLFGLENRSEIETGNAVYTGKHDISRVGQFVEWNGNFEIFKDGGWGTRTAKMINGTGGFSFSPDVHRDHNLTAFITELYRSGYFSYKEDTILHGITVYRFDLPGDELISANQDRGFYPNGPNGVLNLTAVFEENAPVFASKPHFLDADPSYLDHIMGLNPEASLHDSYLDVEPITGAVMRAAKRIQINLQLTRYGNFFELENIIPQLMMPVFWASEEGTLTESLATEFKEKVYGAKYGIEAAVWGGVGLGGLVFLMTSLCFLSLVVQQWRYRRRRLSGGVDERTALLN